jgi:hypothetical protein
MGVFRRILIWIGVVCMTLAACWGWYLYETWPTMPQAVVDWDKAKAEGRERADKIRKAFATPQPGSITERMFERARSEAAVSEGAAATPQSESITDRIVRRAQSEAAAAQGTLEQAADPGQIKPDSQSMSRADKVRAMLEPSPSELAAQMRAARDRRLAADVDPQIEAIRTEHHQNRYWAEANAEAAVGVGFAGAGFFVAGAVPWRRLIVRSAEAMIRTALGWWERARPLLDYPRFWTVIYRGCVVVLLYMIVQGLNREHDVYVSGGQVEVNNTVDVSGSVEATIVR